MRDENCITVAQNVDIAIDGLLHWLDVYMSTRRITTPAIEFQREVMTTALHRVTDAIKAQQNRYEAEEAERVRQREEAEKSGVKQKGWNITMGEPRMGINWSLVESFEQKKFENKERFFLYRKQRSELMCKCNEGDERLSCATCYGTGFDGGWKYAGSFPAIDVVPDADNDEGIGDLIFRTSFFRTIRPDDVIVDEDGKRWRVLNVEGFDKGNIGHYEGWKVSAYSVHHTLNHSKFPLTHLEKKMKAAEG